MGVLLPLLVFALLTTLFHHVSQSADPWRESLLAAAVTWAAWLVFLTETLSLFHLLTPLALTIAWATTLLILLTLAYRLTLHTTKTPSSSSAPPRLRVSLFLPKLDSTNAVPLLGIALIAAVTAAIAFIAPPNTWDSMTYHMARVAHWAQNQSVAHYPTNIDRQLWLNPGAEFIILHLQILTGSDRWANFVQWSAMLGSVIGVSLLARQLGANRASQWFAALFAATLPMGILQSSSTQNDYVVAFWIICTMVFLTRLAFNDAPSGATSGGGATSPAAPPASRSRLGQAPGGDLLLAAAALGLAILTKGTAYLFLPPLLLWATGWWIYQHRRQPRPALRLIALITTLAVGTLLLNAGHYSRNLHLYGSPLGEKDQGTYRVGSLGVGTTVSNVMRNGLMLFMLSWPDNHVVKWVDVTMYRAVVNAHAALGLDPNDRRTIDLDRFRMPVLGIREDTISSPVHTALMLLAFLAWPLAPPLRRLKPAWTFAFALAAAGLLFCFYLRWEPFIVRYLLPLQLLAAAPLGLAAQHLHRYFAATIATLLLILALPVLLMNECRPLVGGGDWNILTCPRQKQYFANRPDVMNMNVGLATQARQSGVQNLGLILGGNDYEYPFWVLVDQANPRPPRMEGTDVTNSSKFLMNKPQFANFQAQATVDLRAR